jgi:hypothetical protein
VVTSFLLGSSTVRYQFSGRWLRKKEFHVHRVNATSHLIRVVAFNTAEGWACDVTEDIARAVWSKARSEYRPIGKVAQEFLERASGADATAGD